MIGERIRQARLAAGLTLDEVAQHLSERHHPITKAALSKYELNRSTPPPATLATIAQELHVAPSYFLYEEAPVRIRWLAFRKHAVMPQKTQEEVRAYSVHVAEQQLKLTAMLYPNEQPQFPSPCQARTATEAELAAAALRQMWGLDQAPLESVTQLIEDHGGVVVGIARDVKHFDGLSGWLNEQVPLAVTSTSVSVDRQRFNIAHELGHLLLWRDDLDDKTSESLAHRFAAALLLPASALKHELGERRQRITMSELALLKQKYGISMQAIARRAYEIGVITQTFYENLCREFSQLRWRKQEPVAFQGNEEPLKLKQMTFRAWSEGMITRREAQQACPDCLVDVPLSSAEAEARRPKLTDIMTLPLAERHVMLSAMAEEAAEDYATDVELRAFHALDGEDWEE